MSQSAESGFGRRNRCFRRWYRRLSRRLSGRHGWDDWFFRRDRCGFSGRRHRGERQQSRRGVVEDDEELLQIPAASCRPAPRTVRRIRLG